jgi:hypothetical protein
MYFQYGQWPDRILETVSSNWRELANLVDSLEIEVRDQGLSDCEIFLFTDNTKLLKQRIGRARQNLNGCLTLYCAFIC